MIQKIHKALIFLLLTSALSFSDRIYTFYPKLAVYKQPSASSPVITQLNHSRWVEVIEKDTGWTKIILPDKQTGYIQPSQATDTWIKIFKQERTLFLMRDTTPVEEYTVGLGFNVDDDKIQQGDGTTPLGRFYICEMLEKPEPKQRYGARSMRVSYPCIEDARRGLLGKLITKEQYAAIVKAIHSGEMPPQNTKLGGSIRIHGGGSSADWTLGCVALNDEDIIKLFGKLPENRTLVEIYRSKKEYDEINTPGYTTDKLSAAGKKLLQTTCTYTKAATAIIPITFPMGDFDRSIGVCTDVAIRALRETGIDLQALMYEDILVNPKRYPQIKTPNTSIDHRRTRNLKTLLDNSAEVLTCEPPAKAPHEWKAGDIVLFDTGIDNGTIYDHIGIVSSKKIDGVPLVINLWTIGWELQELDLLQGEYPKIVGHYRLTHLFDYR